MKRKQGSSQRILKKSKKYMAYKSEQSSQVEVKDNSTSSSLRKATAADKERKRAKRRLKKQRERESKQNEEKEELGKVAKLSALSYLQLWNNKRSEWTFKKKRQLWLLSHIFSLNDISDDNFQILLNHMIGLRGVAKDRLIKESEKVVQNFEKRQSVKDDEEENSLDVEADIRIFERAKGILQMLV